MIDLYASLIESVEDYAIFMLDTSGLVASWNPGVARIKGYSREEILGHHFACFYTAEQQAAGKPDDGLRTAARTGRFAEESWRVRKDGSQFWAAIVISAMRDDEGALVGYAKVTRDLTERLRAEQRLAEANRVNEALLIEARTQLERDLQLANRERERSDVLLQTIIESTPCLIYAKDREGRMLLANPPALSLIGKPWGEVKGRTDAEFLSDRSQAEAVMGNDRRLMRANRVEEFEETIGVANQEERVWLSIKAPLRDRHGEVTGLVGVSWEVTEKKRSESASKASNARMAIASQAAGHGFWDFDIDARTLRWDDQMFKLYGRSVLDGEQPYEIWSHALHPEDRQRCERELTDAVAGIRPFDTEFRVVHPCGAVRHIRALARMTMDANGRSPTIMGINYDITERRHATEQLRSLNTQLEERVAERTAALAAANEHLRQSEAKLRLMVENVKDYAIFMLDPQGRISSWNLGAQEMMGYSSEQIIGQHYSKCHPAEQVRRGTPDRQLAIAEDQGRFEAEGWRVRKDGTSFLANVVIRAVRDEAGTLQGFAKVTRDITEASALAQRISYLAYHDALTGLANRALFRDRLQHACQIGQRLQHRFGLIFLDLNRFKEVNDTLGHAAGDELLAAVAQRLKLDLRDSDTVARLGGDEFVMLVEGLHDRAAISKIVIKINERISVPYVLQGTTVTVSASVGTAVFPDDGADPETLMHHADASMYRAKQSNGPN